MELVKTGESVKVIIGPEDYVKGYDIWNRDAGPQWRVCGGKVGRLAGKARSLGTLKGSLPKMQGFSLPYKWKEFFSHLLVPQI